MTAAFITAACLVLTAGLSLLNSSAIDESLVEDFVSDTNLFSNAIVDDEPTVEDEPTVDDKPIVDDEAVVEDEPIVDDEAVVEDEPIVDDEPVTESKPLVDTTLPALDTLEVIATGEETGYDHPGFEYVIWKDIVIDVFEHKTGKLVGQVWITEDELYDEFCEIFNADFDHTAELFNPHDPNATPVCLPEAEYRVELYWVHRLTERASGCCGSLAFSYGLENNEIYEFTQTGYPLANGETVIAFMESLVAEKIAQLEGGINDDIVAEESFAHIIGFDGENSYWNGTTLTTGEFLPGVPRYTERFPYIAD